MEKFSVRYIACKAYPRSSYIITLPGISLYTMYLHDKIAGQSLAKIRARLQVQYYVVQPHSWNHWQGRTNKIYQVFIAHIASEEGDMF